MTHTPLAAAFVAAAVLVAGTAAAQERPAISLTPANPAQWDIAGHVGWLAADKSGDGSFGDDWYNALSGGLSVGRYLTPHARTEVHATITGDGRVYRQEQLPGNVPVFRAREHHFRTATIGAGVFYQFFDNQWFHPYAGGGLEVLREDHRVTVLEFSRPTVAPSSSRDVSYAARPFVSTGFKWYVAERAFVRAGVRASFSNRGSTHVVWMTGIGADL
jgi:opacity protein-like surface antigen